VASPAFDDFVLARGASLIRFGYVLTGDHHLAEDIVQEVLARMHRRWSRIDELEQPEAYIRKAIVREYLSWRRRRSSTETATAVDALVGSVPDTSHQHAMRDELWRLLATLPRAQRAVLVLRFFEDLPDSRIAQVLGCSETTVRVHASRGLARLRGAMPSAALTPAYTRRPEATT
jgi:RNA polymerase sigma-70 factor (sigma-E family)